MKGQLDQKKGLKPLIWKYQQYYQTEHQFNDVYPKNSLTKIVKDGTYVINVDEYDSIGTYWFAVDIENDKVIYFNRKYYYKYFQTTCIWFGNVWMFLHWIYWFCVE